jgi:diphthamide biosynthesis enzyme Dph1/Dph2-like protein
MGFDLSPLVLVLVLVPLTPPQIFAYFPSSRSASHLQTTSRLLQRRLLSIHSVGLKSSKPLLDELRRILKKERKKSYTLTVGRINPAKLANFEGIECFVLVGCNEGGLVDSKVSGRGYDMCAQLRCREEDARHLRHLRWC